MYRGRTVIDARKVVRMYRYYLLFFSCVCVRERGVVYSDMILF